MTDLIHIPGSGALRITTDEDVQRAMERSRPAPVRRAITASASKLRGPSREGRYMARMGQPWQLRALTYYDQIGEIRFASQFYAKLLSKVRYYPARQLENGDTEEITDGPPLEILHRIQDPGGGRSRLLYDYGRMMFVTGEGVLFGDRLETDQERWRFLWKDEIKPSDFGEGWQRVRYDQTPYEPPQTGEAYRFWTPHPRHSDLPDSPLRSIMDIAEELLILTASVMGTATTRMTNGLLLLPTELSPNSYGTLEDDDYLGDEDPENNIFIQDMMEHIQSQIENPGSAASKVPPVLEGAYEYIDRVRWMPTHDPQTDYMERELRKECVHRLALGMDFPPEFLLGMTDANHWTARQVVYDMWRSYGTPIAERFADDLADTILRPALEAEEFPQWQNIVVAYDDSQVVISPDRTEDADKALDRAAIGWKGYREMKAIPEEFAPSEEEQQLLISMKLRQPIELDNGEMVIPQRGPVAEANGNQPENGPPAPTGGREGSRQESRTASILGASSLALMQCRNVAGVRIRHKCEDCAEGEPLSVVAASLGSAGVVQNPLDLVKGGTDGFRAWLDENGIDPEQAGALCQQLEVYAARTLFQPRCPELPSGFIAAVEKAQEVSHALVHPA